MSETPRYATLQDYLRVIRRRRLLVLIAFVAGASIALLISLSQEKTYEAAAQLSFRDVEQDIDLLGGGSASADEPATQRAAANAELITRPEVTRRVQELLGGDLTPAQLRGAISTRVGVQTNLVILTARAGDPQLAADIANAYAEASDDVGTREIRDRLEQFAESTERALVEAQQSPVLRAVRVSSLSDRLSLIRTLIEIAEPVEIAASAQPPATQVSPLPVRNTILGGLLGLIFGLIAAFIRDGFDHRLRSPHEAHEELGLPVLGRVPNTAFGYAGLAVNGRPAMKAADFEAFRMLRMNLGFLGSDGPLRTILITSGLPEEGKSTVSMSLAAASVIAGQRVLLVECDLRRLSFTKRLGISQKPGLTDYLLGEADPRDILQTIELSEPETFGKGSESRPVGSLVCIAGGRPVPGPAELLVTDRFQRFVATVRKAYDLVILDGSPLLSVVDPLQLIPHVDGVLICVRIDRTTREEARATKVALGHVPERPTGAVVTGLRRGGGALYDYYYGY